MHKLSLFTCFILLCGVVLILSFNLPFTLLFKHLHDFDALFRLAQRSSETRTRDARQYFYNVNAETSWQTYNNRLKSGKISIAIAIVTVKRGRMNNAVVPDHLGYVIQTASKIDQIAKQHNFFLNTVPFICNVDSIPHSHVSAQSLYKYLPYTERYGNNSIGLSPLYIPDQKVLFRSHTVHRSKYQKEAFDYTFCLLSAAALKPDYVLMLEDDVIPDTGFPTVLEHLLTKRLRYVRHEMPEAGFAFFKLYYPLKWLGFSFDFTSLLDFSCYAAVSSSFLYLCVYFVSVTWKTFHIQRVKNKVFFLCFVLSVLFITVLGRQNVMEFRRLSSHFYRLQVLNECCTQAVLYPRGVISSLSEYIVSAAPFIHPDLIIMDFVANSSYTPLQVEPNLFHHTGLITSLDLKQKHPEEFVFFG